MINRLLVIFQEHTPGSLVFKEGLDFLLLAASLDWEVSVVLMKNIHDSFKNEEALLAEYDISTIEIWEEKKDLTLLKKQYKVVITF